MCPQGRQRTAVYTYPSLAEHNEQRVLWYPDREHFTLGKIVGDQWHPTLPCRSAERANHRDETWDGMIVATELGSMAKWP